MTKLNRKNKQRRHNEKKNWKEDRMVEFCRKWQQKKKE